MPSTLTQLTNELAAALRAAPPLRGVTVILEDPAADTTRLLGIAAPGLAAIVISQPGFLMLGSADTPLQLTVEYILTCLYNGAGQPIPGIEPVNHAELAEQALRATHGAPHTQGGTGKFTLATYAGHPVGDNERMAIWHYGRGIESFPRLPNPKAFPGRAGYAVYLRTTVTVAASYARADNTQITADTTTKTADEGY